MALNFFNAAATACLTALFFSASYAYPQSLFGDQTQMIPEPISEVCLGCICESISSCNRSLTTCEGDICGMFRITLAYWIDSGRPVVEGREPDGSEFESCAIDPVCAKQTVTNYMTKFAQDCDKNGFVNCMDYAAIHKLGGYGCTAPLDEKYKNKYEACQRSVVKLSGSLSSNIIFPDQLVSHQPDYMTVPSNSPK